MSRQVISRAGYPAFSRLRAAAARESAFFIAAV
jgi:hypothetical protein